MEHPSLIIRGNIIKVGQSIAHRLALNTEVWLHSRFICLHAGLQLNHVIRKNRQQQQQPSGNNK